jgi:hypothetical protein
MKLRKLNNGYYSLYDSDGDIVASNNPDTPCSKKLSKENCDEIFRVVDVEKLADEYIVIKPKHREHEHNLAVSAYIEGFNKAMELNKDKLFTVDDMRQAYDNGMDNIDADGCAIDDPDEDFFDTLRCIQQPTEIEVDIEMETKQQLVNGYRNQPDNIIGFIAEYENVRVPKLDENGCLILKKK